MERHMSTQVSLCFSSAYQMAWPMFTQLPRGPYIIPTEVCFTDFLALLSQIGSDDYESQPDIQIPLKQWFWDFLMLWPFNTVLHVVVTPSQKIVSLLLHNYWSATVISYNVNILHAGYLICYPKGVATHRLRTTSLKDNYGWTSFNMTTGQLSNLLSLYSTTNIGMLFILWLCRCPFSQDTPHHTQHKAQAPPKPWAFPDHLMTKGKHSFPLPCIKEAASGFWPHSPHWDLRAVLSFAAVDCRPHILALKYNNYLLVPRTWVSHWGSVTVLCLRTEAATSRSLSKAGFQARLVLLQQVSMATA